MIPVSVLPAAGLSVALGRALQNLEAGSLGHQIGQVFYAGGLAVFEQLPVVFAAGVAIGFTGGAGVAALSAVVGYFTLTSLLKVFTEMRALELALNTGVFGGIAIGLMVAWLYNRYHKTQLHPVLGFFSGKRLIPILTIFSTILLSLVFGFTWPPVQIAINEFGSWVMSSPMGAAFYAAGKRLLIPVGLHHVYYQPFLYQFGEFVTSTGKVVHGDSVRYFAGDASAGLFMASEFPIMIFGLPAACLAMVLRARPERRKAIGALMLTAALTSIITGITEPVEFAFIFVAPLLFVVHVLLAFLSGFLTQFFDVHLGYTFSASFIDFLLGYFNQKNAFYFWAVVGPLMALLYFTTFYFLIGIFDFKTPGREVEVVDDEGGDVAVPAGDLAVGVLSALGSAENIESLDACITRLRVIVKDPKKVQLNTMKKLGASGTFHDGGRNFQIVFGVKSDHLKDQIHSLIRNPSANLSAGPAPNSTKAVALGEGWIAAPLKGRVVDLSKVPDPTFANKVMGNGLAIEPSEGVVYAPFDGTVAQMFRTGHAIGLLGPNGMEVLIHVGIETVKLNGEGFKALVKNGDQVRRGDRLIEFDLNSIKAKVPSILTPVVVTNTEEFKMIRPIAAGTLVTVGDRLIEVEGKAGN